ncbi:MAG: hypothetical protein J6R91_05260 [Bacteroidaceae bacterium]|nr:hypothetical protein [Bacteroidaceae bacterium]
MPRLNKILQELNIGFDTAKDYLRKTFGISILSVNDKITEAQYQALLKKYKADKVFYSVIKKTFGTRPTKKNPQGIPAVFNDEEKEVAQELGNILETKRYLAKDRKKKGKRISKGKSKSSSYLTNYVYGYVRFISVPFGGQRRR